MGRMFDIDTGEVDPEQAELMDFEFLVCMLREHEDGTFSDNLVGTCHDCGREVVFRPSSPSRPPRICLSCAAERVTSPGAQ